jgi:hypothetical protein
MKTFFKDSTNVLRRAIKEGVIDPTMRAIAVKTFGKVSLFQPLMSQLHAQQKRYRQETAWLGKQNTWVSPSTRRYQNSVSPDTTPSVLGVALPWLVELARFMVPDNVLGVVKSFEQYLSLTGTPNVNYTSALSWGNPFVMLPNHVQWFFRLSPSAAMPAAAWVDITGLTAIADNLPGRPYTDLPQTSDLWYPATSPAAANVHMVVPGGFCLRAFLLAPALVGLRAAVKLAGSVQSELNTEAQQVARAGW